MSSNHLIDGWTYESVEYSDGYHHSVFDPGGKLFQEFHTENKAREFAEAKNRERGLFMPIELKPCPFCGGEAKDGGIATACLHCGATGPLHGAWNTRAAPEPSADMVLMKPSDVDGLIANAYDKGVRDGLADDAPESSAGGETMLDSLNESRKSANIIERANEQPDEASRERFEEIFGRFMEAGEDFFKKGVHGDYAYKTVYGAWLGWKAAHLDRSTVREIVDWKPGTDRSMDMWNKLPDDPIQHSMPLVFKTTITYGNVNAQTHLRLGYYDGNVNAFIESGMPNRHYRESVDCWYQFPIPPEQGWRGSDGQ